MDCNGFFFASICITFRWFELNSIRSICPMSFLLAKNIGNIRMECCSMYSLLSILNMVISPDFHLKKKTRKMVDYSNWNEIFEIRVIKFNKTDQISKFDEIFVRALDAIIITILIRWTVWMKRSVVVEIQEYGTK